MIDIKKLRIGNLVNQDVLGDCLIVGIKEKSVWLEANHMTLDRSIENQTWHICDENLNPIPLSPEILESCGFKKSEFITKVTKILLVSDTHLVLKNSRGHEIINFFFDSEKPLEVDSVYFRGVQGNFKKPYYLHELQNLFWCLCGEELEINLHKLQNIY